MKSTAQPASDIIYDWNTRDAAVPLVPPGFSLFDETLRRNNANIGGGYIEKNREAFVIRGQRELNVMLSDREIISASGRCLFTTDVVAGVSRILLELPRQIQALHGTTHRQ